MITAKRADIHRAGSPSIMKRSHQIVLISALGVSLALNAAFLAYHARIGTFRRVFVKMDLAEAPTDRSAYQQLMESRYRKLPSPPDGVVFAGDSLIFNGPWAEFYSEIHNRGIPDETSSLLLGRLGDLLRDRPRQLIFLTGANDFNKGVPAAQIVRNYRTILERVRSESPGTAVAVVGMLPVDPTLPSGRRLDNPSIVEANRRLEALTGEFPGTRFLDLNSALADRSGNLRREFTEDGLHLTLEGYLAVRVAVQTLIDRRGTTHDGPSPESR
jgi:lysophospholipase L1-like esterase